MFVSIDKNFLSFQHKLHRLFLNLIDVYKVITNTPKDANEIAKLLEKSVSEVNYKLTLLQLEDRIIQISGKGYIRKNDD